MTSKTEREVINAAGLVQGIVLVMFPAASTIFTDKSDYGLSSSQYRGHVPAAGRDGHRGAVLGAGLARRISTKPLNERN